MAEEDFLRRWSRRKHESAREPEITPPAPAPQAQPPAPAAARPAAPAAPVELPAIDSLEGLASDYKAFLDPAVDENLRRSALKKLFHDPHFNVMDGLDVYIDDYSRPDPIPESMLKTLVHAKRLLFPEEERAEPSAGHAGEAERAVPATPEPQAEPRPEEAKPDEQ